MLKRWLQGDRIHDERDEVHYVILHLLFVHLIHEHYNDWKLGKDFQTLHSHWNYGVLRGQKKGESMRMGFSSKIVQIPL